jgi:DNA-binding NtrC family response regulator
MNSSDQTWLDGILGRSEAMQELRGIMQKLKGRDLNLLLEGESGTGKELVARTLWKQGPRSARPLVVLNCATVPENLAESTLFGHEAGAFTDARESRGGLVQAAEGGTMLLDEPAGLAPQAQSSLLQLLKGSEYRPVGASQSVKADLRFIFITRKNLEAEVEAGRFRRELLFSLNAFRVKVPPLRDRREDIPLLATHFLETEARAMGLPRPAVEDSFLERLVAHHWPGNVRELATAIRTVLILADAGPLTASHLDEVLQHDQGPGAVIGQALDALVGLTVQEVTDLLIRHTLRKTNGNKKKCASLLGIDRRTLYNRLSRNRGSEGGQP